MRTNEDVNNPEVAGAGPFNPEEPHISSVGTRLNRTSQRFTAAGAQPPLIPARSPLRPPPRGKSTPSPQPPNQSDTLIALDSSYSDYMFRNRSFGSLAGLLDSLSSNTTQDQQSEAGIIAEKAELVRPDSPLTLSATEDEVASSSSSSSAIEVPSAPKVPKRTHALLELLSSERAYASDLAFIRDIHIPLALGKPGAFHPPLDTPPSSSNSSSRTVSSSSDSSIPQPTPAMTREDTKVIFGNIAELAVFSDLFIERLEEAMGCVLEEGEREDHVGELFLKIIPAMEPPYQTYITRHPDALQHLSSLPQTPALTAYLSQTRTLATSLTHAWDLPSLLIKPVQRLLKYSLLLAAIIDETPDSHPDKENLKLAKKKMEEVAMSVNEGRRRREVVKEVLTKSTSEGLKKRVAAVGMATSVNLQRMGSMRKYKAKDENEEAVRVEMMERALQKAIEFMHVFSKQTLDWSKTMTRLKTGLRHWAVSFARVIGLSEDSRSEAFDAFLLVLEQQLLPLCQNLEDVIRNRLLVDMSKLLDSTQSPLRLLDAMASLEPLHYGLLNINVSKTRPARALLEASQSYIALRGQLYAELPHYLALLEKGITSCVLQLIVIQIEFWADARNRWSDLWEALRVEGEMNAGAQETERVWWERWHDVEEILESMAILSPRKILPIHPPPEYLSIPAPPPLRADTVVNTLFSLDPPRNQGPPRTPAVLNMLSSLEPASSATLSSAKSMRSTTDDTLSMKRSGRWSKTYSFRRKHSDVADWESFTTSELAASTTLAPSRSRSMSSGLGSVPPSPSTPPRVLQRADRHRGRSPPRPNFRQKLSNSLLPSARNRSPSIRSFYSMPDPSMIDPDFYPSTSSPQGRTWWQHTPARYVCRVVHPCSPPEGTSYHDMPFFPLEVNCTFDVLHEFGHPSLYPDLPLYVDDGEDCLMLVRDGYKRIGWALASFLIPLD